MKSFLTKSVFVLRFFVSIGIFAYLFFLIDWREFVKIVVDADLRLIWMAPAFLTLGLFIASIRWIVLLRSFSVSIHLFSAFKYYIISSFYSIVLPGVIGGDVARVGLCAAETGKSAGRIGFSALMERAIGIIMVLIIGNVALILFLPELNIDITGGVIHKVQFITAGFILFALICRVYASAVYKFLQRFKMTSLREKFAKLILNFSQISLSRLALIAILSGTFQLVDIFVTYLLAQSIGIKLPLYVFLCLMPVVYILTVLPISLGGLGVREGVMVYLFSRTGIAVTDAITLSLMVYFNRIFVGVIGGAVQLSGFKRKQ